MSISACVYLLVLCFTDHNRGIFWACEIITGTHDLLPIIKYVLALVNISYHPFSSCKTPHTSCSCVQPPLQPAAFLKLPSPPSIPEILHLYSTAVWLTQPILPHRNLEEETPSLLLLLLSPRSGGLSRLIYNAAAVGQIFTLTLCAWVYPACREEREEKRENGRLSVTKLQQTLKAKRRGVGRL